MINLEKAKIILSSIAAALATSLLYFKIELHSDSLFLEALSTDLFSHGGAWADWRFSPAPAYLPDMLLYFIAYPMLPDAFWRIFFVSAAQVFILAITAIWTSKQIHPNISKNAISAIILTVAFATLVSARSGMWLYFYTTNNHFASLVFSLLCLGLLIRFLEKPKLITAAILILVGGIAKASTAVYLISFTAPTFVLLLIALVILGNSTKSYRSHRIKLIYTLALLIASHLLSIIFEKLLTHHNPLENRAPASLDAAGNSFKLFLQATGNSFSTDNYSTLFFSLFTAASFIFLTYKLFRSIKFDAKSLVISLHPPSANTTDWKIISSASYLTIIAPINIMGAILSGGFTDAAGYRYFMFPIALAVVLTIIIIDRSDFGNSTVWTSFYFIFLLIIISLSFQFIKKNTQSKPPTNSVATCLLDIERTGFALKTGIADYWNARGISEYLPNKNPILATANDMSPFFWMTTIGPILRPSHYSEYKYNFAILRNTSDGGPFNYTDDTIGKILPTPTNVHSCSNSKTQVWLYKGGELDLSVKASNSAFLFKRKLSDNLFTLGANLPGNTGKKDGVARVANALDDKPGFLSYGPYIDLEAGRYKIVIKYSSKDKAGSVIGHIDMGRFNTPETTTLYQRDIVDASDGNVSVILDVPSPGFPQFEARTWFSGRGELELQSLEIKKLIERK